MNEKDIKSLIEKIYQDLKEDKKIKRIQYVMDFGKVYIQYDFCLN